MASVNLGLTLLAVLTSLACTVFLFRAYAVTALRLLLWSALCFVCLMVNNALLFFDLVVFPDIHLRPYRIVAAGFFARFWRKTADRLFALKPPLRRPRQTRRAL